MRYELRGGPLDGSRGEVEDSFDGNLHFPYEVPSPDQHDPKSELRSALRYRRSEEVTEDGRSVYHFDSARHRQ